MDNIILMGLKHCGKSTQARIISDILSVPAYDTDELIFKLYKKSPREIYNTKGKEGFLEAEAKACEALEKKLRADPSGRAVVATGGGICTNDKALEYLRSAGVLVFLSAKEDVIQKRVFKGAKVQKDGSIANIPAYIKKENPASLEDAKKLFHGFFTERNELYGKIANITVDVSHGTKKENAQQIIRKAEEYIKQHASR